MKTNGGALPGEYTLAQFHFHWGSSDHGGSEHTLEGEQFFSEVHLVHFKSEYGTIGDSVDKSDGLAVLGFFIEEDSTAEVDYHDGIGRFIIMQLRIHPSIISSKTSSARRFKIQRRLLMSSFPCLTFFPQPWTITTGILRIAYTKGRPLNVQEALKSSHLTTSSEVFI